MAASKQQAERDKIYHENQEKLLSLVEDLQASVLRLSSRLDMKTKVKIDDYLPIKTDSDLKRFLDKTDGEFHLRREQLEDMLYCNVTNNVKSKRPFETHFLALIFSREFIASHRWPAPGYINYKNTKGKILELLLNMHFSFTVWTLKIRIL